MTCLNCKKLEAALDFEIDHCNTKGKRIMELEAENASLKIQLDAVRDALREKRRFNL